MIRVGALPPVSNCVVEPEMYKMAPEDITIHFERLILPKYPSLSSPEQEAVEIREFLDAMVEDAPRAARVLAMIQPKLRVIAYACTSGSFHRGIEFEKRLVQSMEDASGIPCITTSGAVIQALKELGLKKLCLISPYLEYQHGLVIDFLIANGFEIVASKGLGLAIIEHHQQPPEVARDLAITTCQGVDCDGIFSSCTAFRTIEILEGVERELGMPMVSANQATMWLMLKKAGVKERVSDFGSLLRHL